MSAQCEIGVVGLGVMGRNLVLNVVGHGRCVVGYDKDQGKVATLQKEAGGAEVRRGYEPHELVRMVRPPRSILLLVPAGPVVDSVIQNLLPYLDPGDLLIDGGNSHFKDTDRRISALEEKRLAYLGLGISGGEHGARLMAGGDKLPSGPSRAE